ncbi:type III pantothenate kinase [uncultured Fusobacterium sp.]|jgi:type III pantothenate kinase|uniref:type III pantothenate kinase n=2 Tax=uncultured Fusobacterium sp. TaxID=159267 RepID=UPI0025D9D2DE|nr:type III pantothenate kinase [uncultured Fusobacterium sp.]
MLLAIDIGNTHIVTGILDKNGEVLLTFRVASNDKLTEDEYFSYLRNISEFNKIDIKNVEGIIVASVVPNLITIFQFLGKKYFHIDPMIVGPDIKIPFTFAPNLNPTGFGADRIIDIVQSLNDYPDKNLVIFDFGSATTYEVLEKTVYVGGGILPGIEMSINALFANTAKLPKVKFSTPESVLGKNTNEQIQAGIFYGYAGQIKHIIKKIKEVIDNPFVVATGGLGKILSAEIEEIDVYSPDLSIKGLYTLYLHNKK